MADIFAIFSVSPQPLGAQMLAAFDRRIGAHLTDWGMAACTETGPHFFAPATNSSDDLKSQFLAAFENIPRCTAIVARIVTDSDNGSRTRQQPTVLNFLGNDWLFVNDLTDDATKRYVERLPDARVNGKKTASLNIFEYLRNRALEYVPYAPKRDLTEVFCEAYDDLLESTPEADCNIAFTNGKLSFILVHHRPVYLCHSVAPSSPMVVSTFRFADNGFGRTFERNEVLKAIILTVSNGKLVDLKPIPYEKIIFDVRRKSACEQGDFADLLRDRPRESGI